jgi:hypothetical protein
MGAHERVQLLHRLEGLIGLQLVALVLLIIQRSGMTRRASGTLLGGKWF